MEDMLQERKVGSHILKTAKRTLVTLLPAVTRRHHEGSSIRPGVRARQDVEDRRGVRVARGKPVHMEKGNHLRS